MFNDYKKTILYVLLVVLGLLLFNKWQLEHPAQTAAPVVSTATITTNTATQSTVPTVPAQVSKSTQPLASKPNMENSDSLIWVNTDVLKVAIDLQGGNIVAADLLKYKKELHSTETLQLFNTDPEHYYVAQSGLTGSQGPDTQQGQVRYTSAAANYTLAEGQNSLVVNLHYQKNGVDFTKSFTFKRGNYAIEQAYQIDNHSGQAWQGNFYSQLLRHGVEHERSLLQATSFTGAAFSSPNDRFKKMSFSDLAQTNYSQTNSQGWAAMVQHYFLSAWVPAANENYHYFSHSNNNIYTVGMISPTLTVPAGQNLGVNATLYVGPAIESQLDAVAPHLSMAIDYGWLWFISAILFWVLKHVHDLIGNWGWAIVIVTILIKACFYFLSAKSYRSMAHMRRVQPKMLQIRERYADDRQAQSKAMMELYRKEKCNPMSGCLPMLVQIPFFIAFYYMISASVELRQAPFLLWIHDLSSPDPYYILPIIMGASMFLQQKLNPPAPDPVQQKVMMFLPVIFTFMFLNFPAGLVLYWLTNNIVSVLQQWIITRQVAREEGKDQVRTKKR